MVSSSDVQRLFLQVVFSRGILSYSHALVLWKKYMDAVKDIRASDRRDDSYICRAGPRSPRVSVSFLLFFPTFV
ncbi:hypothetical protein EDD16DRAFT_1586836 [Pisolithus croceorrhizus]|nr:hypothetical protein EDD16DRAFT_1586836 [Pisolithus croceorrhizus]